VIVEPPIAYVLNKGYQPGTEVLEPFAGYWVKSLSDTNMTMHIPAIEAVPAPAARDSLALAASSGAGAAQAGWRLELRALSRGVVDFGNYAGMSEGAATGWDGCDRSEPPMNPGRSISLYFPHRAWGKRTGDYTADVRGAYEAVPLVELVLAQRREEMWGHVWRFDVAKNFADAGVSDEVTLEFRGVESVPPEAAIYFIDRELERLIDVRTEQSYSFHSGERESVSETEARFTLIVGSAEFMDESKDELPEPPGRTVLHQNYPNPFNPSTIVRYDLARASVVRLAVYDASGALVKILCDGHREPGRYEEVWDGKNERGRRVSTGIYFSRLETGDGNPQTRKMLLIR
jgi:hypothetical protein